MHKLQEPNSGHVGLSMGRRCIKQRPRLRNQAQAGKVESKAEEVSKDECTDESLVGRRSSTARVYVEG
jgi:hypothetical protein